MSTNRDPVHTTVLRTGYSADFLGTQVEVPTLDTAIQDDAVLYENSEVVPYTHFSLSLSASRRLARWVGWNIDGAGLLLLSRTGIDFAKDPRVPAEAQTGNELYAVNRLDRGHLARRSDLLWGELPEVQQANRDSFYYTNIAPQMDDFNQSSQEGIWGGLENALYADVDVQDLRASVFAGPVFGPDDRVYREVALPAEYWKLLVFREEGVLKTRAFLLTQDLDQLRAVLALDEFRVYQITIEELESRTHLRFPEAVHQAGALPAVRAMSERRPLGTAVDIS